MIPFIPKYYHVVYQFEVKCKQQHTNEACSWNNYVKHLLICMEYTLHVKFGIESDQNLLCLGTRKAAAETSLHGKIGKSQKITRAEKVW